MMFLGASHTFSSSLHSMYFRSPDTTSNPFERDPKIDEADPKVPCTVFLNKLPVPFNIPFAPSRGPSTKPSIGF
jgi:hypothetical protein